MQIHDLLFRIYLQFLLFFDRDKYKTAGIKLQFLQQELIPYVQKLGRFVEGLSIIDLMMFCKEDEIRGMMEHYELSE